MAVTIIPDRLVQIERGEIHLSVSSHHAPDEGMCVMEAASWLAGETFSDHPACVSPTIGALLRSLNDGPFRAHLDQLLPYAMHIVGTAAGADVERQRGYLLTDWAVREMAATAMDAADLPERAAVLRALPPVIDDQTAQSARSAAAEAAEAAWAAGAAEAAWAAWAAEAARAARAAEAAWAAWAARAARAAGKQDEIRASALALLDRLIAVT